MAIHRSFISCGIGELFNFPWYVDDKLPGAVGHPGGYWDLFDVGQWLYGPPQRIEGIAYVPPGAHNVLYHNSHKAMITFSDVDGPIGPSKCEMLVKKIQDFKLGTVTKIGPVRNPNTLNNISLWVWVLDQVAFKSWYNKALAERSKRK